MTNPAGKESKVDVLIVGAGPGESPQPTRPLSLLCASSLLLSSELSELALAAVPFGSSLAPLVTRTR